MKSEMFQHFYSVRKGFSLFIKNLGLEVEVFMNSLKPFLTHSVKRFQSVLYQGPPLSEGDSDEERIEAFSHWWKKRCAQQQQQHYPMMI